ncbi:hypothetical protein [Pseudoalteromonas translucida]|uniref:hypothetical protein n=1 Tax=Pseudoalteromonas translucida TaxID=166935 RepID=UPI000A680DC2|nr:hypothetical protein [Pseudoalteromonas translucida]
MNNKLIGDSGEYFVSYNLSRRGLSCALMNNGAKGVDILVTDDGKSVVSIQVKTSQGKSQPRQWMVGKNAPSASNNFFFVFCNIWKDFDKAPEVFIIPSQYVKDNVNWDSTAPLFKITPEVADKYRENWEQILALFI